MIQRLPETKRLEAKLRSLGHQIQRQQLMRGMIWLSTIGLLALLGFFILDYMTRFPYPIRLLVFLGGLFAGISWYRRCYVAPNKKALNPEDVSLRVEKQHPELQDRLISTLQFQHATELGSGTSESLVEGLVRQTFERIPKIKLGTIVDTSWRPQAMKRLLIAAGLVGLMVLITPTNSFIFALRLVFPGVSYPTATRILDVDLPELIPAGDPVPVRVVADGALPELGRVHLASSTGDSIDLDLLPVADESEKYQVSLPPLQEPAEVTVHLGDADTYSVYVTPEPRPALSELSVTVDTPGYSGLGERVEKTGNLRVLTGSRLHWRFHFNKPITELSLESLTEGLHFDSPGKQEDGSWTVSMTPQASLGFQLRLHDQHGLEPRDPPTYRVTAFADQAPVIRLDQPRGITELAPPSRMPLQFTVSDDFGLGRVLVEYVIEDDDSGFGLTAVPPGRRKHYQTWDKPEGRTFSFDDEWLNEKISPRPGQTLRIWIAAEDIAPKPQRAESQEISIRIISTEEYRRLLWQRLGEQVERIDDLVPEIKSSDRQLERIEDSM
jgi:hypothetical protein